MTRMRTQAGDSYRSSQREPSSNPVQPLPSAPSASSVASCKRIGSRFQLSGFRFSGFPSAKSAQSAVELWSLWFRSPIHSTADHADDTDTELLASRKAAKPQRQASSVNSVASVLKTPSPFQLSGFQLFLPDSLGFGVWDLELCQGSHASSQPPSSSFQHRAHREHRAEPEVFNRRDRIELKGTSLAHFAPLRGKISDLCASVPLW